MLNGSDGRDRPHKGSHTAAEVTAAEKPLSCWQTAAQPGPIRAKKMSVGPFLAWGAAMVKMAAKLRVAHG